MVDPVLASRLQFALTAIVHIIFPVVSMGLAPFLVYFTWKEIRTDEPVYEQLCRFWARIPDHDRTVEWRDRATPAHRRLEPTDLVTKEPPDESTVTAMPR